MLDKSGDDLFMPIDEAGRLLELVDVFLAQYATLHQEAYANSLLLWAPKPKFHWLWHLADKARYLHPRVGNCCQDEDFCGKMKVVCQASFQGTQLHKIPNKVMTKWRHGKDMLLRYGIGASIEKTTKNKVRVCLF